ncbi:MULTISPECIES: TetR/AcrR family transcriptional regulator [Gracilibacillus]|uniref:TetR/AcrR family transcriptional regulator n=1 Tax=Gracilibacillus TaxID=74385 RepID=UPI000824039B|nr:MULTISPECIES: TetR/AcrR family transcriptional regulator [Gracilibacillus]
MEQRIIQGFAEELKKSGIKFTMDDLARHLGISKRTLYEHFSSKADILDALIEDSFSEVDKRNELILQNDAIPVTEKIKQVIISLPTHIELVDRPTLEQIKRSFPKQWEKLSKMYTKDWDEMNTLIDQAIREGIIVNKNPALIVKMIRGAIETAQDQQFYIVNDISITEALSQMTDIILYGLISKKK